MLEYTACDHVYTPKDRLRWEQWAKEAKELDRKHKAALRRMTKTQLLKLIEKMESEQE